MTEQLDGHFSGVVRPLSLEQYSEKYKDYLVMKRENGILEVALSTDGGPYEHSWGGHDAWSQAWLDIGNDPENEVLIITGTGDKWFSIPYSSNPDTRRKEGDWNNLPFREWSPDAQLRQYRGSYKLLENLVFQLDIPTIAVVNGPGAHVEFALACDLTLAAPDAKFFENHFIFGVPPGDGLYLIMQELLGPKRSAYYMYTGEDISGQKAVDLGLVNEVLPREELLARAWELAEDMMRRSRATRYITSQISKRRWKKLFVEDLEHHMAHQHLVMAAERQTGTDELRKLLPAKVPFVLKD
ncbi:enoyl-CoA hydratase/isomerase family protein [Streptomyces sp. NPDC057245]|uniref:enoyl-CoA hydratase/isomerase family protein n=1 Tax=Streptomyces TaxID=1883 RepID=UPI001C1E2EB4|nr:enoyl-CoA hydratase/isomerase family protein [Streptomyces sp. A108]MBU6533565.1 enoyl-CoA hydratase/isomerase family protein [Streptomyces sp. A108]